jgi:hypothetical protein
MKNNLIFTGLFESPREYTEGILREFIKNELGIEECIEFGNVHHVPSILPVLLMFFLQLPQTVSSAYLFQFY